MARSAVKVDVWNRALLRIGETKLVESEEDSTPAAEACRLSWDDLLEEVLEAYPWPWARKQAALSVPAGVSRTGWEYVYSLPDDCVTPLALLAEGERIGLLADAEHHVWEIQSSDDGAAKYLCCDLDSSTEDFEVLEYTWLHTDIRSWPRSFVDAVVWRLAAELALALKADPKLAGSMLQAYEASLPRAAALSHNAAQYDQEPTTPTLAARG